MTIHMPDSKATEKSMQNCQSACSLDQTEALQSQFVPAKVVHFSHCFSVGPWSLSLLFWFHSSTHQKENSTPDPDYPWLPQLVAILHLAFEAVTLPTCVQPETISHFPVQMKVYAGITCSCLSVEAVLSTSPECRDFCILVEEQEKDIL